MIRTFTALFLPDDIRDQVGELVESLRRDGGEVKWVSPELLHLTVRFFGDLDEDAVERVEVVTGQVAEMVAPIRTRIVGAGTFPPRGRPRVYWLGLQRGRESLVQLGETLNRAYRGAGLGEADRPLSPHLTIGRARPPRRGRRQPPSPPPPRLRDFGRLTFQTPEFIFQTVSVVRSELSPHGPTYTPLAEYLLTGQG
jgi:2'-5' RNA ligase